MQFTVLLPYANNWIGKDAVVNHHKEVPFHLLRADAKRSVGEDSGNLLVQGDNLMALKALLPHYAGQVKCIYIDPPYNTGNENWVYNDAVNSPEMRVWLGKVVGGDSEDLSRHDKWLCMMDPRLVLLRQLLSDDGAIFISIDDNEVANIRYLMDEIFGLGNFVINLIWEKKFSPQNDEKYITATHDHIMLYARNKSRLKINLLPRSDETNKRYTNPDNDPRGPWSSGDFTTKTKAQGHSYEIISPSGKVILKPGNRQWGPSYETYLKLRDENRIWFGEKGNNVPRLKQYLSEVQQGIVPMSIWKHTEVGHNQEAKQELNGLINKNSDFETPKPTRLIKRILQIASNPGDLILDSFAGSGTTGHAVLKQNAEDGGNRRFILVEMDENICQNITAERLKRAALGYTYKDQKGNEKQEAGLGGGFRYCELGETLFNAQGQIRKEVAFEDLARHVYFTETGQPLDLTPRPPSPLGKGESPLLGVHNGVAVYLLYNGILKDKSAGGGNVLTRAVLTSLPAHDGPKVIYGNGSLFSESKLRELGTTFRQVPYEIKVN